MIINNLQVFFDKSVGDDFLFKTADGQSITIAKKLLEGLDYKQKLFLSLNQEPTAGRPQDILNDILEINND